MSKYIFEKNPKLLIDVLDDNDLFRLAFRYRNLKGEIMFDRDTEWMKVLNSWSFEEIFTKILENGGRENGFFSSSDDIVYCLFPKYNKNKENLEAIYKIVDYNAHGDEQPVFFVDTTFSSSRKDGVLFTTKAIYRKSKGMITYSPDMEVKIDSSINKEIFVKDTRIISYNGSKRVFEDIRDLFQIVYIFNNIRHEIGTETYGKDMYNGVWFKDENGNMRLDGKRLNEVVKDRKNNNKLNDSGVGKNTRNGTLLGVIVWIVIFIFIFKGCGV